MRRISKNKKVAGEFTYKRIFPVFLWHTCEICGQDFKHENGWNAVSKYYDDLPVACYGPKIDVCEKCAPTEEHLINYLNKITCNKLI